MCGHISIEKDEGGRRVVESYFPDTVFHDDVTTVTDELVQSWALPFSKAGLILIGAGPPCQGVSKLNADRQGTLKDHRSCLFAEVRRVRDKFRVHFPWAQVHTLMESVASQSVVLGPLGVARGTGPIFSAVGWRIGSDIPR